MSDTTVTGLSDLNALLQTLPVKFEKNILKGALRAGMKPVLIDAKAGASVASGVMRAGLKVSANSKGGQVTASIKAKGKHGFLANFVEYGTAAHRIGAEAGGALSFGGSVVRHVDHPGQRARPFMRPALDSQAGAALLATGEYIKKRLAEKHGMDTADIQIGGTE